MIRILSKNLIKKEFSSKFSCQWIRKMSSTHTPVEDLIRNKLSTQLQASHLEVINESFMHNVPKGSETHFKVIVVSKLFDGVPLIKRHRMVNDILKTELGSGVHALAIEAKTEEQWNNQEDKTTSHSPSCLGGFGK